MKIQTNTTLLGGDAPAEPAPKPEPPAAPTPVVDAPTAPVDVTPPSETPTEPAPETQTAEYPLDEEPHMGWKRAELDAYARDLDIENPEDEANKGDVLALIEGAGE
ncbi:MAG: hypothetical protein CL819_01315 [Croceicoccus sp.]|nr:hypothetical protein [Croceicoccus sp.]